MVSTAKSFLTAGAALVGAGVITASHLVPVPQTGVEAAPSPQVSLRASAQPLLGQFDPAQFVQAFIDGTIEAYLRPGPVPYTPVDGPLDGLSRIGQGLAATGLRFGTAMVLTPLGLLELAAAYSLGDTARVLEVIENLTDGPLWVVDPALYGLRDALPAPLGGADGIIENLRNELWKATQEINAIVADPQQAVADFIDGVLLAYSRPAPVPYTPVSGPIGGVERIVQGVIASGMRLVYAGLLTPLGVLQLAGTILAGDTEGALDIVENLVDGPLWVADPLLYGLRDALPAPLGGPNQLIANLRLDLWRITQRINEAIRDAVLPESSAPSAITSIPDDRSARSVAVTLDESPKDEIASAPESDEPKSEAPQSDTGNDTEAEVEAEVDVDLEDDTETGAKLIRPSLNFSPSAAADEDGQESENTGQDTEEETATVTPADDTGASDDSGDTDSTGSESDE
ncbi:Uncharacterised protein [Mycolicibacterium phlei]|nr:hypothetical protein MPHLCCUG_04305 [Mycolicibacterium phlei]STZ21555.1 Uncharacterised protein [Mycolicibacterium phlei]VEG11191.1 Uncharacterised protein [Mycobacteroides chelonae]